MAVGVSRGFVIGDVKKGSNFTRSLSNVLGVYCAKYVAEDGAKEY